MDPYLLDVVCGRFGLGEPTAIPSAVTGGLLNTMWKVEATNGTFAVKVLNEVESSPVAHFDYDNAYRLERAAAATGVLVPEALLDASGSPVMAGPQRVVVHRWIDGQTMHNGLTLAQTYRLGEILGQVHQLDLQVPEVIRPRHLEVERWKRFAASVDELCLRQALSSAVDDLETIDRYIDEHGAVTKHRLLTHNDINHKNLMMADDALWVIDWESSSMQERAHSVGVTALDASSDDDERLVEFLSGYQSVLALPEVDETWLVTYLSNQIEFFAFNLSVVIDPASTAESKAKNTSIATKMISNLKKAASGLSRNIERLHIAVESVRD